MKRFKTGSKILLLMIGGLLSLMHPADAQNNSQQNAAVSDLGSSLVASYDGGNLDVAEFARRQPALLSWAGIGADGDQIQLAAEDIVFESLLAREAQSSGLAEEPEVREQINKILKAAYLRKRVSMDEIEVEDPEIERYYTGNREKFRKPEVAKFSHILLGSKEAAEKLRTELGAGSWEKAVSRSADLITAKRNGSFGEVPAGFFTAELSKAATSMTAPGISDPVKTVFGYHLLRRAAAAEPDYYSVIDVRKEIYDELMRQKRRERLKTVQLDLWKKYDVEIERPTINELVKRNAEANANVDRSSSYKARTGKSSNGSLQVISDLIDLGKITPQKINETFLLANSSDKQIEITRVASTCPCVTATVADKNLKAGQVTRINFTYDPNVLRDGGNTERVVFIESSDTVEPKKYVRFRSYVDRESGTAGGVKSAS